MYRWILALIPEADDARPPPHLTFPDMAFYSSQTLCGAEAELRAVAVTVSDVKHGHGGSPTIVHVQVEE